MHRSLLGLPLLAALACGEPAKDTSGTDAQSSGDGESSTDAGTTDGTASTASTAPTSTSGMSGAASTGSGDPTSTTSGGSTGSDTTGGPVQAARCGDTPPEGAVLAPEIPAYGGTCPVLETGYMDGQAYNILPQTVSGKNYDREFLVIVPEDMQADEKLPVIFLWHWLGGEAKDFYTKGDVQNAVNQKRFIAVIPEARSDVLFKWPFTVLDSAEALEAEFIFFDDMLSCVNEQFGVDKDCVSSTGVSAGALFTSQLAGGRGDRLSSFMSLSGGTGGLTVKPWTEPQHKLPAMVLWGGPNDFCVAVNFQDTSHDLEMNLEKNGHFVLECVHNCNHSTPPFPVPEGMTAFAPLWDFVLDHPYWLAPGDSPYLNGGLPDSMPDWCAIGVGNAVPPAGTCDINECS